MTKALALATLALALAACREKPVAVRPSGQVAASWDGGAVTVDEVRVAALRLPPGLREQFLTPAGQREFVSSLVAKKLLYAEAQRRGLVDDASLKEQVRDLEERLAIEALLHDAEGRAGAPSDEELRKYFEEHRDDFRLKPRVRAARIFLKGDPRDAKLRARAVQVRARLAAKEPVAKVALTGDGAERAGGGDIGWLDAQSTDETKAALALTKVGEATAPVETAGGLAIFVLLERVEGHAPVFEEVRQAVLGRYGPTRQRRVFDRLVRELTAKAQVQVAETP